MKVVRCLAMCSTTKSWHRSTNWLSDAPPTQKVIATSCDNILEKIAITSGLSTRLVIVYTNGFQPELGWASIIYYIDIVRRFSTEIHVEENEWQEFRYWYMESFFPLLLPLPCPSKIQGGFLSHASSPVYPVLGVSFLQTALARAILVPLRACSHIRPSTLYRPSLIIFSLSSVLLFQFDSFHLVTTISIFLTLR